MRILQLIDSLEAGGAERMAVQYANELSTQIEFSGLVATRKEGNLKAQIAVQVPYVCLFKRSTFDWNAVFKLRNFIQTHRVNIIHAHSSTFFIAVLVKFLIPTIKIIWHDHYGNSDALQKRSKKVLRLAVIFFSGIIAVNENLKRWSLYEMHFKNAIYLPNFATVNIVITQQTSLRGTAGKRIVCLANLRPQKNHFLLLHVAEKLKDSHLAWTFHLVGKDFKDSYSDEIRKSILKKKLENSVFLYDSCADSEWVLEQSEIGVLSSKSEGLPVALLEYGLHKIPVIVTNVGQIAAVVSDSENGFLVPSEDIELFYQRLVQLIADEDLRERFGMHLYHKVNKDFSASSIIQKYIQWVRTTIAK